MIGKLPDDVLEAVLEKMPVEFSVVDRNDKVLAWNKHNTRLFKRPAGVIGRDVHDCHPKKSILKVEQILLEMKEGKRESARFWIDLPIGQGGGKQKILIEYYALRNPKGEYIGCLEATQNIEEFQSIAGEKRLLD
jgi:hypothetical protein